MAGGLMQLVAYGAQDIYLTGNPQITFFKVVYRRHTNFSMECIRQSISGQSYIGITNVNNKGTVTISRNGDLVTGIYIKCEQDSSQGICGDYLVDEVEIEIGGQRIDKHYKEWNQIWNELTIPASKAEGFKYMTGGFNNDLVSNENTTYGTRQTSIQYPLNFWFCRNPGLALPLIALQYHEVQLKFTWGIGYYIESTDGNLTRKNISLENTRQLEVWVDYIYLDTDERRRFSQVSHEYLIEQLQVQKEKDISNTTFKLNLEHPIKEIIWTTPNMYPISNEKIKLEINGHDRFSHRDKEYFTLVQPYIHHTSIPGYNIKELEQSIMLTKPIHIISGEAASMENTLSLNGTFRLINSITDNLEIYSSTTLSDTIKIGDILDISYCIATDKLITIKACVIGIGDEVTDGLKKFTIGFNVSSGTNLSMDTPLISKAGAGHISIISRLQNPQSRCSQLKKDIYVYSFSLEPEEHQPSGTCNFSRIDSAKIIISSSSKISNIYAVNYNVLRIMSGMGGLAYSS